LASHALSFHAPGYGWQASEAYSPAREGCAPKRIAEGYTLRCAEAGNFFRINISPSHFRLKWCAEPKARLLR
jgi:hypothetical protein